MTVRMVFLPLLFTVVCASLTYAQSLWYEDYDAAMQAMSVQNWLFAEQKLKEAIRKQPRSGRKVKIYGSRFIKYIPDYQLALVYFYQGLYSEAQAQFQKVEQQGILNKGDQELVQMTELRKLIAEKLEARQKETKTVESVDVKKPSSNEVSANEQELLLLSKRAEGFLEVNDLSEAEKMIELLRQRRPDDARLPGLLARLDQKKQALLEAQQQANRDQQANQLMKDAEKALETKRYSQAMELARTAKEFGIDSSRITAFIKSVETAKTKETLQQAIRTKKWKIANQTVQLLSTLSPGDAEIEKAQAMILDGLKAEETEELEKEALRAFYSGKYEQAIDLFTELLRRNPESVAAHFFLGCSNGTLSFLNDANSDQYAKRANDEFRIVRRLQPDLVNVVAGISPRLLQLYDEVK